MNFGNTCCIWTLKLSNFRPGWQINRRLHWSSKSWWPRFWHWCCSEASGQYQTGQQLVAVKLRCLSQVEHLQRVQQILMEKKLSIFQSNTRTRSCKENFSINLRYAVIRGPWLAENGHVTFVSQWECSNSSIAYIYAEILFIGSGLGLIIFGNTWEPKAT